MQNLNIIELSNLTKSTASFEIRGFIREGFHIKVHFTGCPILFRNINKCSVGLCHSMINCII